jgi:hypothetical protein
MIGNSPKEINSQSPGLAGLCRPTLGRPPPRSPTLKGLHSGNGRHGYRAQGPRTRRQDEGTSWIRPTCGTLSGFTCYEGRIPRVPGCAVNPGLWLFNACGVIVLRQALRTGLFLRASRPPPPENGCSPPEVLPGVTWVFESCGRCGSCFRNNRVALAIFDVLPSDSRYQEG